MLLKENAAPLFCIPFRGNWRIFCFLVFSGWRKSPRTKGRTRTEGLESTSCIRGNQVDSLFAKWTFLETEQILKFILKYRWNVCLAVIELLPTLMELDVVSLASSLLVSRCKSMSISSPILRFIFGLFYLSRVNQENKGCQGNRARQDPR